ncbi:MAG: hypothetical protein ABL971_00550 [Vicinamibacterales bacterium]
MSIDCDAQLDKTLAATDAMDDAKEVLDPLQAEFDKYSFADEEAWYAETEFAYRCAKEDIERVLADMEAETKLLETAEAERVETAAKLEALIADNDALVLRLQELDDARVELEVQIADLWGVLQPDADLEDAKAALDAVNSAFDAALTRLDELAQEIGAAQDLLDHLDDQIALHTDNLFELAKDFEDELAVVAETQSEYEAAHAAYDAARQLADENGWGPMQDNANAYNTAKLAYDAARAAWTEELKQVYGHCPDSWEIFEEGDVPDEVWEVPIEPRDEDLEEEDPGEEEDEDEVEGEEDVDGEDVEVVPEEDPDDGDDEESEDPSTR